MAAHNFTSIAYQHLLLFVTDTRGLQSISHCRVLPISVLLITICHLCNMFGRSMMEYFQQFQHCSCRHPTLPPIY